MGIIFFGVFLLGMIFGRVIVVEMVLVGQLAYLSLMTIENVQPLMMGLFKLAPV